MVLEQSISVEVLEFRGIMGGVLEWKYLIGGINGGVFSSVSPSEIMKLIETSCLSCPSALFLHNHEPFDFNSTPLPVAPPPCEFK